VIRKTSVCNIFHTFLLSVLNESMVMNQCTAVSCGSNIGSRAWFNGS